MTERFRWIGFVVVATWLAVVGTASAASVRLEGATLVYHASPGEANELVVSTSDRAGNPSSRGDYVVLEEQAEGSSSEEGAFSDYPRRCRVADVERESSHRRRHSTYRRDSQLICPSIRWLEIHLEDGNDAFGPAFGPSGAHFPLPLIVYGGSGTDYVIGGARDDRLYTGDAAGSVDSDDLEDVVTADAIHGFGGDDRIFGDSGEDLLGGGSGEDRIYGYRGGDWISGGEDDDRLLGGDGNDELDIPFIPNHTPPGSGTPPPQAELCTHRTCDFLIHNQSAGSDYLEGGRGVDSVSYSERTQAVRIDLRGGSGNGSRGENDRFAADLELAFGGSGGDTIIGNTSANSLIGQAGGDEILSPVDDQEDVIDCGEGDDGVNLSWRNDSQEHCDHGTYTGCPSDYGYIDPATRSFVSYCIVTPAPPFTPPPPATRPSDDRPLTGSSSPSD